MDDSKTPPDNSAPSLIGQDGSVQAGADGIATAPTYTITPDAVDLEAGNTCPICTRTGLAILPFLHTVVPAQCPGVGLEPFGRGRGCAVDVKAAGYDYALRIVRAGYLYAFFEKGPRGKDYYELYAVDAQGRLWYQVQPYAEHATTCCQRVGEDTGRQEFLVIEHPEKCGKVWLAYSQHKWTPEVMDRYAEDARLRAERMQPIEPAKWIVAPRASGHIAPADSPRALQAALEYRTFDEVVEGIPELPHHAKPRPISRADGSHDEAVLRGNATRYPWWLRNLRIPSEPEPDIALTTAWQMLRGHSHDGGPGRQRRYYPPMLVALWDAIGIVHELNGYRHDVLGHIARYRQERELQLEAAERIDEIEVLLQQHAGVMADRFADHSRAGLRDEVSKGDTYVAMGLRGSEKGLMHEHGPLYERYRSGQLSWDQYLFQRNALIDRHAALSGDGLDVADPQARRQEIRSRFAWHDEMRRLDTPEFWHNLSSGVLDDYRREATDKWQNTYRPLIDEAARESFQGKFDAFLEAATGLLEQRSRALGQWLGNELFLATLEDYDTAAPVDGVAFEQVITEAVDGLAADRVGRSVLTSLAGDLKVSGREALLWRVVAQNQQEARKELEQTLAQADSQKNTVLDAAGAGWSAFVAGAGHLKKYLGYYKKFEEVRKEAVSTSRGNALLKETGADRFITAAGTFLLGRFPGKQTGDTVGGALVQHVLQVRAQMDAAESSELINLQAQHQPSLRRYFHERVLHHRSRPATQNGALLLALQDLDKQHGHKLLQAQWKKVADKASNPVRLAGFTAVLELVNFADILTRSDKDTKDYGDLLASGLSLASIYVGVTTTVSEKLLGEASRSYANAKALGSALGGAAALIGVVFDWFSVDQARQENRNSLMISYAAKALLGTWIAGAQLLTGLAYSAPVLQRVIGRGGMIIWLEKVRYGIEGAAALRTAQAAGKAAGSVVIRQGALVGLGRWVLYLAGWQVAVGVTAVQGLIWFLSPNALEDWCERNYFGKVREKNFLSFGGSDPKYKTAKEQEEAFEKAIVDVHIAPTEVSTGK